MCVLYHKLSVSDSPSSLSSQKDNSHIPEIGMRFSEPLDYIFGEDIMAIYKVGMLAN